MKNLVKKSIAANNGIANFQAAAISKFQMNEVKGGEDIIIVEEVVGG